MSSDSASCSLGAIVLRRAAEHRLSRQSFAAYGGQAFSPSKLFKEGEIRVEKKDKERGQEKKRLGR